MDVGCGRIRGGVDLDHHKLHTIISKWSILQQDRLKKEINIKNTFDLTFQKQKFVDARKKSSGN